MFSDVLPVVDVICFLFVLLLWFDQMRLQVSFGGDTGDASTVDLLLFNKTANH